MKKIAIIMVNWNGSKDTCECLDSFRFPLENACFFIVDNKSDDDSVNYLQQYACERKIEFQTISFARLENDFKEDVAITIIPNERNAGFAIANNDVLRFLLKHQGFEYAWLLNNDTVVTNNTLTGLLTCASLKSEITFWGSVILDYNSRDEIQCCGVNHYKYLGVSKLFLKRRKWSETKHQSNALSKGQDYQNGASLFVKLSSLNKLGLMDEKFFLYSEEADWQLRGQKHGFFNKLCLESIVYHKGSMSTAGKRHVFFFHYNQSAILLTRKNFGLVASVTSSLALLGVTFVRSRFSVKSIVAGIKGIVKGWLIKL